MAKFFTADKSFIDYITILGFVHREVDSEKKYYVNSKGKQIKINYSKGLITLMNKNGNTIDYSSTFTNEQIDKFSVREDD